MTAKLYDPDRTVEVLHEQPPANRDAEVASLNAALASAQQALSQASVDYGALLDAHGVLRADRDAAAAERDAVLAEFAAVRVELEAEVARLLHELGLHTTPAPQWVGPDIVVPKGVAGQPIAEIDVVGRFTGKNLVTLDTNDEDCVVFTSTGKGSGLYPEGSQSLLPLALIR